MLHKIIDSQINFEGDAFDFIAVNVSADGLSHLTHCGQVTPYVNIERGQHLLRWWVDAWRHQVVTWTNVELPSVRVGDNYLRAISQEMPQ